MKFFRPEKRCHKDVFFPKALILPDLTLPSPEMESCTQGDVLSVEVKPKQGFYFPRNCVHETLCNFCLKQWHKLSIGQARSLYCPRDLYSGDKKRMMRALRALFTCPQNNLRLFRNGKLMHGEDVVNEECGQFLDDLFGCLEGQKAFGEMLVTALTSESISNHKVIGSISSDDKDNVLPKNCILNAVLNLQKQTTITDEEALDLLKDLLTATDDIAELQRLVTSPTNKVVHQAAVLGRREEKINLLRNYMLSVSAKDLSMILTMRESAREKDCGYPNKVCVNKKVFCYSWSIVDLDPKQLEKISKRVSQKLIWLDAYRKLNQATEGCKEKT